MSWSQIPTFLKDPQGRVYTNPAKDFIQPFELPIDQPNQIVSLLANQSAGPFPLTAQRDGPIEIFYVKVFVSVRDVTNPGFGAAETDYNIRFLLEHPGKRKQFMNRACPLIACAGDGGRPYVLTETIFIPAVQSLNVTFINDDATGHDIQFVLGGIKFYPNSAPGDISRELWSYIERRERTYHYWQTTDSDISLTALQTDGSAFMTIPDDADLEAFKLSAEADGAFRVRLRDGRNDRALTGNKIHSSLLFGAHQVTAGGGGVGGSGGIFPARWPTSLLLRRSTQLEIDIDDMSNATNLVKLVLGGRKISYAS